MQQLSSLANAATSPEVKNRIKVMHELDQQLHQCVGEKLAGHCRVANFSASRVLVHVDSPVWHSKLRFLLPQLRAHLRHPRAGAFRKVDLKVHRDSKVEPAPLAPMERISERTAALLKSAAEGFDDPRLQAVLRRLAKHT